MLVYPSSIGLSSRTLRCLTGRLAGRRSSEIGTRWRRRTTGRQDLLALAHLRCGDTCTQVLTDSFGRLLWVSPALPGSTHDLTAARTHGIVDELTEAYIKCWVGKAYQGAGHLVRVPIRRRRLKRWQRPHNSTHAKIRCLG